MINDEKFHEHGPLINQENIAFSDVLENRFGKYFSVSNESELPTQPVMRQNVAALSEFCVE